MGSESGCSLGFVIEGEVDLVEKCLSEIENFLIDLFKWAREILKNKGPD